MRQEVRGVGPQPQPEFASEADGLTLVHRQLRGTDLEQRNTGTPASERQAHHAVPAMATCDPSGRCSTSSARMSRHAREVMRWTSFMVIDVEERISFRQPSEPVRIAIDDAHLITPGRASISSRSSSPPAQGSQMALAGRDRVRLPLARWRADGSLLEIGPDDLAMDEREASVLDSNLG